MKFPYDAELQREILYANSPKESKAIARSHDHEKRKDWNSKSIYIMYWVLRLKLAAAHRLLGATLTETGERDIVEISRYDNFWGARPNGDTLVGANVLGRVWQQIRDDWSTGTKKSLTLQSVTKPKNKYGEGWMLLNNPIT